MKALGILGGLVVLLVTAETGASPTVTTGIGVSAFQAGVLPSLAITPHVGVSMARDGWTLGLRDSLMLLPTTVGGVGVNNSLALSAGYAWPSLTTTLGATFSQYVMTACSPVLCGRVVGLAPGVDATVDWFSHLLAGALGVRAAASVGWYGGASAVLSGGLAVVVTAGPIVRLGGR